MGVLEGESVNLVCNRDPPEWFDWWQNSDRIVLDGELIDTERFNFSCVSLGSFSETCQLTIISAQMEDSGEYSCYTVWGIYYSRVTVLRE